MSSVKPYRAIPILDCGEPLVPVLREDIAHLDPHPYITLGAPYGGASPWMLRESILDSLRRAQQNLHKIKPGWRILLTDAYRPNAVQVFMVAHELTILATQAGLDPQNLPPPQRDALLEKVYRAWAIPSTDSMTPPPHSTGAAFDCTLIDADGHEIDMGSPVDENSDRSYPDFFAAAPDAAGQQAHANRNFLRDILHAENFRRNPAEWWHFSRGDQMATWINGTTTPAIYGRADLL